MSALNPLLTDRSRSDVSTTSVSLLSANALRKVMLIQNVSAVNIGVSTGTAVIGGAGTLTLAAGESLSFSGDSCPQNAFNVIAASGTVAVTAWEI